MGTASCRTHPWSTAHRRGGPAKSPGPPAVAHGCRGWAACHRVLPAGGDIPGVWCPAPALQTASLVPQQTLHFLDEVQNNARFLGQNPTEPVATRRQLSGVGKGRYTPGELVFHEAPEAQDGQITTPQEVKGTGLALGLTIAVDDAAIDTDKGRIDHGCALGAARTLGECRRWQGFTTIVGKHRPGANVRGVGEVRQDLFPPVGGENGIVCRRRKLR